MGGLALLLVVAGIIYLMYRRSAGWRTLKSGAGPQAEELEARYAYLKSNQVKCRLQSDSPSPGMAAVHTAASAVDAANRERVKLEVHKKDLAKAEQLLQQFEEEQPDPVSFV
ncbi:hypothetical protein O9H85_19195 [Paenibacillus filicis]|uniref:Uncharacterized protein n=1 Tax=Paenibacillus gyeongsangnamensis TaxID=3388067 RepID=A0ABT4QC89_9BACL|nr:hypothetical protein [Paenibacillus filicis]MCZ8514508.1 hypothetical protein [Paenibacillus filicis]